MAQQQCARGNWFEFSDYDFYAAALFGAKQNLERRITMRRRTRGFNGSGLFIFAAAHFHF